MRFLSLLLALTMAGGADAQERRPRRIEIDGIYGYTAVNLATWGEVRGVSRSDRVARGIAIRGLLTEVGRVPVGLEVGSLRLFRYEVDEWQPGVVVTHVNVVGGYHVMLLGRFVDRPRVSFDLGAGFQGTGEITVPGVTGTASVILIRRPRFHIPVGARLNLVLNEPAWATALGATIGISVPLDRDTNDARSAH